VRFRSSRANKVTDQDELSDGAFEQSAHRTGAGREHDQIHPVTREVPVFKLGRSQVNAHDGRDLTSAVLLFAARFVLLVEGAGCQSGRT
jgi:hypothetical protein